MWQGAVIEKWGTERRKEHLPQHMHKSYIRYMGERDIKGVSKK